jgi:hypothetical protein
VLCYRELKLLVGSLKLGLSKGRGQVKGRTRFSKLGIGREADEFTSENKIKKLSL